MISRKNWFVIAFLALLIGNLVVFSIKNSLAVEKLQTSKKAVTDSLVSVSDRLGRLNFEKDYLSRLITFSLDANNKPIPDDILVYEIDDVERKFPKKLTSIIKNGKKKLIIRYTEIGCNACTDSTFQQIRKTERLKDKFETIVLVDFTEYEYYLKWRKIADVQEKVLWLEKGRLPFEVEQENTSYMFIVGGDLKSTGMFVPNSLLTGYLKSYLQNI
jgi:hypothetical protein